MVHSRSRMNGKTVWVIGASSGIGEAIAEKFHKEGATLIVSARRSDKLESLATRLERSRLNYGKTSEASPLDSNQYAPCVKTLPMDIAEVSNAEEIVSSAWQILSKIDIVVFAAGVSNRGSVEDTELAVHRRVMEVNYFGVIAIVKEILPKFKSEGSGAFIVISSVQGKFGIPNRSPYAASKHALHGYFDSLRYEVFKENIGVLLVCPGYVRTELSLNALTSDGSKHAQMDQTTAEGFSPKYVAEQVYNAFLSRKEEVVIAQTKVHLALALKAYVPSLFSWIMKNRNNQ